MWFCLPMTPAPDPAEAAPLPDDVAALKALLLAERATAAKLAGQNEHLRAIVKELRRAYARVITGGNVSHRIAAPTLGRKTRLVQII